MANGGVAGVGGLGVGTWSKDGVNAKVWNRGINTRFQLSQCLSVALGGQYQLSVGVPSRPWEEAIPDLEPMSDVWSTPKHTWLMGAWIMADEPRLAGNPRRIR